MKSVFSQEGILWRALNKLTDIFVLSLMFLTFSVPVVTTGAALTALYDSTAHCVRYGEERPYTRFWTTFRRELKPGIFSTLLWGVLIASFLWSRNHLLTGSEGGDAATVIGAVYYVALLIPCGAFCWTAALLSRFTFTFRELILTALRFTFFKLPVTVLLVIMTVEALELILNYIFPAFFLPAVLMLLWSLFTERVFTKLGGGLKKPQETPDAEESAESEEESEIPN